MFLVAGRTAVGSMAPPKRYGNGNLFGNSHCPGSQVQWLMPLGEGERTQRLREEAEWLQDGDKLQMPKTAGLHSQIHHGLPKLETTTPSPA